MALKRSRGLLIAVLLVIVSLIPLIAMDSSANDVWAPPPKTGHITADETWSGTFWTQNVVIDMGVTVTVDAGSTWLVDDGTFIFVDGTLHVNGTESLPVTIEEFSTGIGWNTIQANSTGKLIMENFSCEDSTRPITLLGQPSVIKKGTFTMVGGEAIYMDSAGGHSIETVRISGGSRGIFVYDNEELPSNFNGVSVNGAQVGFLSHNGTALIITRSAFLNGFAGISLTNTTNMQMEDVHISRSPWTLVSYGMFCFGIVTFDWTKGSIDNVGRGVSFQTDRGSQAVFSEVNILSTVTRGFESGSDYEFKVDFIDCAINSRSSAVQIDAPTNTQHVDFINTTWSGGSVRAAHGSEINVSWYLEMDVADGNLNPLDINTMVFNESGAILQDMDILGGHGKVPVQAFHYTNSVGIPLRTTVDITSLDSSTTKLTVHENSQFNDYRYMDITMDLWPVSSFPMVLEMDEDVSEMFDLDDYFTDIEGSDLTYTLKSGENLTTSLSGSEMTIMNANMNWFGETWLEIVASDGNNETSVNVTIDILPVNDAPSFLIDPPYFEIEEEGSGYFNFTDHVFEAEDDEITWTVPEVPGLDIIWDEENLNLTFTGVQDWFGLVLINVYMSDGDASTTVPIEVNVTPINDLPVWSVILSNGTEAPMVEYAYNETTNWTVYLIETVEDVPVEFWINASDVETEELAYSFMEGDLLHGEIVVEVYQVEIIVNETTNETEMQNVTVPMNFTYSPFMNDHMGDIVMFNVSDGIETTSYKLWFKVESVNDDPVFDTPVDWNITADIDILSTLNLGSMISDVDGDELVISTDSEYITVNGTVLEILYNDTFDGDHQSVMITISDPSTSTSAILMINIDGGIIVDDDDDDDTVDSIKIIPEEDSWKIEVEGDEGQTLFLVIEDIEGAKTSYPLEYSDGSYKAEIPSGDGGEGYDLWVSTEEDGEPIETSPTGSLPGLKEKENDPFPVWIIILILVVLIVIIAIGLFAYSRGKGVEDLEE